MTDTILMTNQEVFDKVAKHLLIQGEKSIGVADKCAYRGENGKKCAIGCLIPDAKYDPSFEGKPLSRDDADEVLRAAGLGWHQRDLGQELQLVHDGEEPENWKGELYAIATKFDLNTDVLETS